MQVNSKVFITQLTGFGSARRETDNDCLESQHNLRQPAAAHITRERRSLQLHSVGNNLIAFTKWKPHNYNAHGREEIRLQSSPIEDKIYSHKQWIQYASVHGDCLLFRGVSIWFHLSISPFEWGFSAPYTRIETRQHPKRSVKILRGSKHRYVEFGIWFKAAVFVYNVLQDQKALVWLRLQAGLFHISNHRFTYILTYCVLCLIMFETNQFTHSSFACT